ncbi:HD-GYP domain-containing protein [Chromobacterium violaceum]|uniref:HD-GYP domain-containing protein n=1 Tax=Chromobacterium violaceum TaxID=536 RepID=UPI0015FA7ED6|nr:two-component system response regulator [Chromobacterium violaceum]MBA8735545.1 two-component system response regulator [Chromobacterium violaceum]
MSDANAAGRQTVLLVDDSPESLTQMYSLLKADYRTLIANGGERALQIVEGDALPDLVLLDVMMPGLGGLEVCRRLKADPRTESIPVIFLTAMSELEDEQAGFDAGAADYIVKPVSPPIMMARVRTHLRAKAVADFLEDKAAFLQTEVERRTREVQVIQDVTIMALASLAETRDHETGNHLRRTQNYVRALALELRNHPNYRPQLSDETVQLLYKSAPLHDIGKVGIPDHILLKPGPLTPEEFEVMKTHTVLGRDTIASAERMLDAPSSFLRLAREIAYCHQEKWDGSGYPQGLAGEAIPLSARLMAVADVYDALISRRVYKPPFSHEKAVGIIRDDSGRHFDPAVVKAFLQVAEQFREIARLYSDADVVDASVAAERG